MINSFPPLAKTDHFVTEFSLQRHTAIFGVACLGVVATEDAGVSTCDEEKTCVKVAEEQLATYRESEGSRW